MKGQIPSDLSAILEMGEGQFLEFKESVDKSLNKEIVAFANASGGSIYIGITDHGIIKGIDITNRLKSQIQDIAQNCDPPIHISIGTMTNVLVVQIPEGANKPYSCSAGFFMRMGANSQKMSRDQILTLAIKTGKIRFDEQVCTHFNWEDFDNDKFKHYLKLSKISYSLPREEILRNLRVLGNDGFTHAGVLFFAKEPYKYIISSRIRCVHFGDDKRLQILDKKMIDYGIIGNIEFAFSYLIDRIPVRYVIQNIQREEFPEYSLTACREAIVNAITHFDYFLGDSIAIEKHESRISILNKGELLFPKEDFGKRSEARNRLIADLLARTNYMEKAGTGIQRIKDACSSNKNEITFDFTDAFQISFESNLKYLNGDTVYKDETLTFFEKVGEKVGERVGEKVGEKVGDRNERKLNENQEKILLLIEENNSISARQLAEKIGISQRKIEENIVKIKKMGILVRKGSPKSGYWEVIENRVDR
jgi:ATP-dependent DNA helicase RecG